MFAGLWSVGKGGYFAGQQPRSGLGHCCMSGDHQCGSSNQGPAVGLLAHTWPLSFGIAGNCRVHC